MQAINLNSLLEEAADSGDDALQQLLDFSLKRSAVVELIHRRRDETRFVIKLLKTFASLLNFEKMKEDLYFICTRALDERLFAELRESLSSSFQFSSTQLSKACGEAGIAYNKIPQGFKSLSSYLEGLVAVDNLELFLPFEAQVSNFERYMIACGRVCAKKIMTHYMSPKNLLYFMDGVFDAQNKDTLSFLRAYPEGVELAFIEMIDSGLHPYEYYFSIECIHGGLIVLSESGWQTLKSIRPTLYKQLQNDV